MDRSAILRWMIFWEIAICTILVQAAAPQTRHAPPYRIAALQAKLFYEHSATFSDDIFANPKFALWNVIIGEGDAKEPSNSTLILVVVGGQPSAYEPMRKVEITATRKSRRKNQQPVLRRVVETGILSKQGKQFIPLWLYNTGSEPITIRARLIGNGSASDMRKTINFQTGE